MILKNFVVESVKGRRRSDRVWEASAAIVNLIELLGSECDIG